CGARAFAGPVRGWAGGDTKQQAPVCADPRRRVTMSRQSVAKAHQKIQELSWDPVYHEPVSQYGTDYTFQKAQKKDPLKQVLRSYFPMQEEKDHRVYGA